MQYTQSLQSEWAVSIVPEDAILLASGCSFNTNELVCADDPENHPKVIDLAGDPSVGKRPLTPCRQSVPVSVEETRAQEIADFFVSKAENSEKRLPNPFLSYAKKVHIPQDCQDKVIFLTLDQVRYHITLVVNGKLVAHYLGGLEPHRFNITEFVTPDEDAMLLITVGDVGVSGHRIFDPYNYTGTRLPTCEEIRDNHIHPVHYGGADRAVGYVTLEAVPPVRTEYVFANPKVAKGELHYTVALANDTDEDVTARLFSEAINEKVLLNEEVAIPAHSLQKYQYVIPWADAIFWDTDNPHLYDLRTTLAVDGNEIDEQTDYFGFREFTINGHSFYLNGKKIHLFGQSGHIHGHNALSLEEKVQFFQDWKTVGNVTHTRLHARVQDKSWVTAADRSGMLITTETALWTTGFASFDWAGSEEACYENVRKHFMDALVRRDRNNPSVIIWSLSNEMSPITPFDLENPKMATMTRALKKIIAETEAEDDSRIVQMSSAMDFIGNLKMYNLHYPKNWQAFPDYPHTAYWLDSSFLFPWYGPKRHLLPSWGWRKDKPLYFGEFTCVFGATPDNQASIVGDIAFEQRDYGSALVNAKLWPLEINAYRRLDVSGFCAWEAMFGGHYRDVREWMQHPGPAEMSYAQRPVAVLDHSYRTKYFAGDEVPIELSLHNDTRHELSLSLRCEVLDGDQVIWTETMPAAIYGPAESVSFTNRFRAPIVEDKLDLQYRATLTTGEKVVDTWTKTVEIWPKKADTIFPTDCAFYDPDGILAGAFAERGLQGGTFLREMDGLTDLSAYRTLWLNFAQAKLRNDDWRRIRHTVEQFVKNGGCVVLDQATTALGDLPVELKNGDGYAEGGRLEITYAYNVAPHHPIMRRFTDADFSLWGEDYYVAHRCLEQPQSGNAIPLLIAGTDRGGLIKTPLLEIRYGQGAYLISTMELFPKLFEAPIVTEVMAAMAGYQPPATTRTVGICAGEESWRCYQEIGIDGQNLPTQSALAADIALVDGVFLTTEALVAIKSAITAGKTVYLHELSEEQTQQVLAALALPGTVVSGEVQHGEWDMVRHNHMLVDGVTNNNLFWIVGKDRLAAWTPATLHPKPASACIQLAEGDAGVQLTRRGAVTVYPVGQGMLVIDNLRWQLDEIDEPERPRRYLTCLLTNMGVGLTKGVAQRMSQDFETAEERRERGHF